VLSVTLRHRSAHQLAHASADWLSSDPANAMQRATPSGVNRTAGNRALFKMLHLRMVASPHATRPIAPHRQHAASRNVTSLDMHRFDRAGIAASMRNAIRGSSACTSAAAASRR